MKQPPDDPRTKARRAWGAEIPAWVEALAEEATRTSGAAAARRIGYSQGVVSGVLARNYKGDYAAVEGKVSGALMGATVMCPGGYGEIPRDRCLDLQKGFLATSSARARVYQVCRSGTCPHSRIKGDAA